MIDMTEYENSYSAPNEVGDLNFGHFGKLQEIGMEFAENEVTH